jgi:glycosyltransferase involved in cell wall biosynthesis
MPTLSVIIIALNEEANLLRCLESVKWADELVVADTGSTDRTLEIAKEHGTKTIQLEWEGFGKAKQRVLEAATSDWVLSLDADEVVTESLREEIQKSVRSDSPGFDGYFISRRSMFLGHWMSHGGWYPDYVLRLFKRGKGRFEDRKVHESLSLAGRTGRLKGDLLHYSDPDLEHYLRKMNRYTTLSAQELSERGEVASLADLLFRPMATFWKIYLFKGGFLDGIYGFLLALFSSVHVVTKYVKLWLLNRNAQ